MINKFELIVLESSANDQLDESIIEALNNMNHDAFKSLITKLMESMGLDIISSNFKEENAKIEAKIGEDVKNASFPWYRIMVERKTDKVTPEKVQEFVSERKNKDSGMIYISTASFSNDAMRYAKEFDVEIADDSAFSALLRKFNLLDDVLIYRDKEILENEVGRFLPSIDELENIMGLGEIANANGNLEEAFIHFTHATKLKPNYDTAWYKKGLILNEMKEYEEALKAYMEALEIDIENAEVWFAMGVALFYLDRYKEEIQCYDKAIELDKDYLAAWNNKGATLLHLKRFKKANKTYDEILKIDPNFKLAWNNKGIALKNMDKIEEALECFINAIKIDSRYLDAWMNRGLIYFKEKRYKIAYQCFQCVLQLDKEHIQALYHKAKIFEKLGQYTKALEIYEKILVLDPKFYQAKRRQKKATEYKKKKENSTLDPDFFELSEEEARDYRIAPKPQDEKKILIEKKETKAKEAKIHYNHLTPQTLSSNSETEMENEQKPPESSQKHSIPAPINPSQNTIKTTYDPGISSETQNLIKMKNELKEKENELTKMEAMLREKYFTMENEREEVKHIRMALDKKKAEIDSERHKAQIIADGLKDKAEELSRSEKELRISKDRLHEDQAEIERERLELQIRSERMSEDSPKSKEDEDVLDKEFLRINAREQEINSASRILDEEREDVKMQRMTLESETKKLASSKEELSARERSIKLREEDLTKRFDQIVERSGDTAIKEKELEEMALELKRSQDNLQKKAKTLRESEMRLLEKQKLLSETRATMKGVGQRPQVSPYKTEVYNEFKQEQSKNDSKGGETTSRSPSLSTTLDHERYERELMIGEIQSLSDIMAMYSTNQNDLAQKRIDEAQKEGLDSKLIWNIKGNILRQKNEFEKALVCYNNALKRDQNYVITLANMMALFSQMAKYQEALDLCKKILLLRPHDEKFVLTHALLEAKLGHPDEAISTIDNLLIDNDKLDVIWNLKGILLFNMNQYDDALECFEEALKLNPESAFALNNKGVAFYKIGKFAESLECFIDAQKIVSNEKIRHNFELTNPKALNLETVKKSPKKVEEPQKEVGEPEKKEEKPAKKVEEPKKNVKESPKKEKEPSKEVKDPKKKGKHKKFEEPEKKFEEPEKKKDEPPSKIEDLKDTSKNKMKAHPKIQEKGSVAEMFSELGKVSESIEPDSEIAEDIPASTTIEIQEEEIEDKGDDVESEERSSDLYMCPSCGSFVSPQASICEQCGYNFDEEDEEEEEIVEELQVQESGKVIGKQDKNEEKSKAPSLETIAIIEKFTLISGVGESKAEALFHAGFTSYESLRKGKISDIGQVKGIGESLAKSIKDQLKKKKFKDN
jgi:tetratricopeptide (TPR) repeat protein